LTWLIQTIFFHINRITLFLAIGSYTFPWAVGLPGFVPSKPLLHEQLIDLASYYKAAAVQYGDNLPLHTLDKQKLASLKEKAGIAGIKIEVGTRKLSKENLSRYIELAAYFESPFLRMVIDDTSYEPSFSEIIRIISASVPVLRNAGVQLAIENHDRFKSTEIRKIIIGTDPDHVGVCLDTANSIGCNEGIIETMAILMPFTLCLHAKDVTIKRVSHKMGFIVEGTAAGAGMLDLAWVVRELRKTGKCHSVVPEIWLNPSEDTDATIAHEKKLAEQSIDYIKQLLL
jgi:3-oxoisoapionate decarboxylase